MRIKKTTIYAVQALRECRRASGTALTNDQIARRLDIHFTYAVKVDRLLKRAGLIQAARGPGGGYTLARDITETSIAEFIQKVDGDLLDDEAGETEDMLMIRRKMRKTLVDRGWRQPISALL
jgi:Rrf2 family iron-sulfur cluster assembly transcriptional regulator